MPNRDSDPHALDPASATPAAAPGLFGDSPGASNRANSGAYQVLARKYRPRRFEDLIGQDAMVRTLANAFRLGRIAHAFMLTGVRGVGKTTTARLLARALTYKSASADGPTLALDPPGLYCEAIIAGAHPDVLEMDAASHTGVANMRDLLDGVAFAPAELRRKIYIIDEVHMLSTAAFNSLLKTLEEPPPHVAFIFATTEIRKVPVTILSRCQRFDLRRAPAALLAAHLGAVAAKEGARVEAEALALLARAAEGSVRDGLSLLDQAIVQAAPGEPVGARAVRDMLGLADGQRLVDLFETAFRGGAATALSELADLYALGAEPVQVLRDLMEISHQAARFCVLGGNVDYEGPAEARARLLALAESGSPALFSRLWQILLKGLEEAQRAPDPLAAAELALIRLAAAADLPGPEEAAALLRRAAGEGPHADARIGETGEGESRDGKSRDGESRDGETGADRGGPKADDDNVRDRAPPRVGRSPGSAPPPASAPRPPPPEVRAPSAPAAKGGSAPPKPATIGFLNLINLLEAAREMALAVELENFAIGGRVEGRDVIFGLAPGAPRDLASRLAQALEAATGESWRLKFDPAAEGETLAAARKREKVERIAQARAHPMIAALMAAIPGLEVTDVAVPGAGAQSEADAAEAFEGFLAAPDAMELDGGDEPADDAPPAPARRSGG